ncbi:acyl-CoA dehydrogenase family protein [Variovorax ginsengisoli]|uniref:Acyl-CoA dehydrogenase family protein n=1 Tax=Variovorax ginsengisoli TaxID=363844 RepID=A0ABT8S100_9BURK|nr:acyl-CoA dehydrogenase family protein [Variovorax ginsengisoli]MDN8613436.1 acyl-CoA dehydrogenase family protein [Variovorax ginsengisoli]MDO1532606.1 acyl-CoA dehydrogenase family protein [Variovorax ginsengisoli]
MSSQALRRLPVAPHEDAALLARLSARFAETAADHDRDGSFPRDNFAALQAQGLIALVAPREHGGGGASLDAARRVLAAVAYGEPATALILTMTWLQHHAIGRSDSRWPAHLRERVLRDAVRDGALINALRVEPALGSPARGGLPATTARRDGDQWKLSGHKLYTTGIEGLRWLSVWGRTDEPSPRVGVFLVPRDAPGVRVVASWDHLGLRASGSHEVIFEEVAIPLDHAVDLRAPAEWAPDAGSQTDVDAHATQQAWMVVLLATLYDAVARAARDWLLGFLNHRAPSGLGAPLASLPRVQETVGEIEALLRTNRVLLDEAAAEVDAGHAPSAADSGLLKYTVTTQAIRAVELALQSSGNHGLTRHNPLERHYRDVLCSRIHTPQNDAILVAAGKGALGAATVR